MRYTFTGRQLGALQKCSPGGGGQSAADRVEAASRPGRNAAGAAHPAHGCAPTCGAASGGEAHCRTEGPGAFKLCGISWRQLVDPGPVWHHPPGSNTSGAMLGARTTQRCRRHPMSLVAERPPAPSPAGALLPPQQSAACQPAQNMSRGCSVGDVQKQCKEGANCTVMNREVTKWRTLPDLTRL